MSPKEALRGEIKGRLKEVPPGEFSSQGEKAAALLRSSSVWPCYGVIFLFLSMNSEIDTLPLLETALKDGKKAFAPRVEGQGLSFYPVLSAEGPWRRGAFGIREPLVAGEFPAPATQPGRGEAALIVAPGLAFDEEGNRLGKGGGYYDRFFGDLDRRGVGYAALGLCMDFQVLRKVPAGEQDRKMDYLLTKNGLKEVAKWEK